MGRLSSEDARRVREIGGDLARLEDGAPSALGWFVPALRAVLGADKAMAYVYAPRGDGVRLAQGAVDRIPDAMPSFTDRWLADKAVDWTNYHPMRPEPAQRDRVLTWDDIAALGAPARDTPLFRDCYVRFGLGSDDQIRVLACEGASLLAWIGVLQAESFDERQRRVFRALVPAVRRRLAAERLLSEGSEMRATLDAAFEAIGAPAFLVREDGMVADVNAVGRAWLSADRKARTEAVRDAARGRVSPDASAFRVTKIVSENGASTRSIVVYVGCDDRITHAAMAAARSWGFTRRQSEVLLLLGQGLTNRAIAAELAISEVTVEAHLTAMFEKADVESRAELLIRAFVAR